MPDNPGLRLTCATLGAFTKYPIESLVPDKAHIHEGASTKKFGFFQSEREFFTEVADPLRAASAARRCTPGGRGIRSPFSSRRRTTFATGSSISRMASGSAFSNTRKCATAFCGSSARKTTGRRAEQMRAEKERIEFLRALAIGAAVQQTRGTLSREGRRRSWRANLTQPLIDHIPAGAGIGGDQASARVETIYCTPRGVEIEAAGFAVLGGLLDDFVAAVSDVARRGKHASPRSRKLLRLVPGAEPRPESRTRRQPLPAAAADDRFRLRDDGHLRRGPFSKNPRHFAAGTVERARNLHSRIGKPLPNL